MNTRRDHRNSTKDDLGNWKKQNKKRAERGKKKREILASTPTALTRTAPTRTEDAADEFGFGPPLPPSLLLLFFHSRPPRIYGFCFFFILAFFAIFSFSFFDFF